MSSKVTEYLNGLSNDVENIYLSNKNLTSLPDLSRFYNLQVLFCDHNRLTTITEFPPNLREIYCDHNQLTSLPPFPQYLQTLCCDHNQLGSLPPFNINLEILNCQNNLLTSFPAFRMNLIIVYCQHNQIPYFNRFNESLEKIHCYDNMLTMLPPLPPNLQEIFMYDNPVDDVINSLDYSITEIEQRLLRLYNFKKFWFLFKFKNKFRDWLWIKVREPVIREKYSAENLMKLLKDRDEEDLDELLSNW